MTIFKPKNFEGNYQWQLNIKPIQFLYNCDQPQIQGYS